jgi:hypothetical protein
MSDSEDNSLTHEQEVQALIDELTVEGEEFLYSEEEGSSDPILQEEEGDSESIANMTMIMIGGVEYETRAAEKTVSDTAEQVLYRKTDREALSTDERQLLFKSATQTVHKKYDVMPLSLDDEDKLDDTYNLEVLVQRTKREHFKYDMNDVFTIVIPNADGSVKEEKDLYSDYSNITIEQVARSNLWYRQWMVASFFEQNLQLTYEFFQNNVSEDLGMKISETYETFKAGEQGGPLFFILMMNHLLSDTEEAAQSLNERVKKFSIKSVQGENIYRVVSLLRGAMKRLQHINKMPDDIVKTLLNVMQTSSVDAFNAQFNHIQRQRKQNAVLRQTGQGPDFQGENILMLAESEYRDMLNENTWTGIHTKGNESIFQAGQKNSKGNQGNGDGPECWNGCGGNHMVQDCKKPIDQNRVNANKKKFFDAIEKKRSSDGRNRSDGRSSGRGRGGGGRGGQGHNNNNNNFKWMRPRSGEKNKRVIDGKPHTFNWGTKLWSMDQAPAAGAAPPATTPNVTGVNFAEGTKPPADAEEKQQALFQQANLLKRVQGDLSDLASIQTAFFDSI